MGVLETEYKEGMNEEDAIKLVSKAIEAGIYHDLGSGSNLDVCIIKKGKTIMHRNLKHDNFKMRKFAPEDDLDYESQMGSPKI